MTTTEPEHILLIEDDPSNRESFGRVLRRAGYRVSAFGSAEEGLEELKRVGSSRVDLQACKLEYSIVSPK